MLCTAHGVDWPLPPDADGKLVPGWSIGPDEAQLLGMAFPAYLDWAATADGAGWLQRLRIKWAIEHAARQRDLDEARNPNREPSEAEWRARGYRGGRCDPGEFSDFDDGDAAAAA